MINTPHEIAYVRVDGCGNLPVSCLTGRWMTKRSGSHIHVYIEFVEFFKTKWAPENDISFIWEPIINDCSR